MTRLADDINKRCGNCKWFDSDSLNFSHGLCKASPPVVLLVDDEATTEYPIVDRDDWRCGSWTPEEVDI